ncbi:MAG: vWA domain-containing protein [Planctomycetota bacterium]
MAQNQRNLGLIVALAVLFITVLGGVGWFLIQGDDNDVLTRNAAEAPIEVADDSPDPVIVKPEPETPQEDTPPDPLPTPPVNPGVEPANLPLLSKFRRRVLEADLLTRRTSGETLTEDEKNEIAAQLLALQSRFAPYVISLNDGTATTEENEGFQSQFNALFKNPDLATESWERLDTTRVSMWQRSTVALPEAEIGDALDVPLKRRRQEAVNKLAVGGWLDAIEAEYGKAGFESKPGSKPLDILVFRDPDQYREFALKRLRIEIPKWSAGFFTSGWEVVAVPVNPKVCLAEVIRHEMFHALQSRLAPKSLTIPWFSEGTAEWLDKAPPENGVLQTNSIFANMAYGYLGNLIQNGLKLKLRAFMNLQLKDFYANPKMNYLMAYCLVDFLRTEEEYRPIYFEFWELLKQGIENDMAFARTLGGLDFESLTRRFKDRIAKAPTRRAAPRFLNDPKVDYLDQMPAVLPTVPVPTANEGEIAPGWYDALEKLEQHGFDTSKATYLAEQYDELVVAVDSSETMGSRIKDPTFDFDALSRWLFSMRYAPSLKLTRKSKDGKRNEAVPPAIIMTLVESVILDKVDDFKSATGISVSSKIQSDIKKGWKGFVLNSKTLMKASKRELARYTAESIAWYWGVRQNKSRVTVIDFNSKVVVKSDSVTFAKSSNPLASLFKQTESNKPPKYSDGVDCDWWAALQKIINIGSENGSKKFAFIMLTDGPNSSGTYGHTEGGRDPDQYLLDQQKMAKLFSEDWQMANLGAANRPSVLQIVAMPGAEGEGLDELPKACPQARLDEWIPRFKKK